MFNSRRLMIRFDHKKNHFAKILIQMLSNPQWCTEVRNITIFQPNRAHFKPARKAQIKTEMQNQICFLQIILSARRTSSLIIRS